MPHLEWAAIRVQFNFISPLEGEHICRIPTACHIIMSDQLKSQLVVQLADIAVELQQTLLISTMQRL